jgi:hypothetical protein
LKPPDGVVTDTLKLANHIGKELNVVNLHLQAKLLYQQRSSYLELCNLEQEPLPTKVM